MDKFEDYKRLEIDFEDNVNFICYYMKGAYSKEDVWLMSRAEREECSEFISKTLKEERKNRLF